MFSIGDFARHGRVSVRMLRHYDAIGLLQPAYVDQVTGYRSYEAGQLTRLNRIVALKDLGFTLQQVQSILDDKVSLEELRGMLRLRQAELQSQIAVDTARLAQVEARLQIIEMEGAMPAHDVQLKRIPRVRVAEITGTAASFEPKSIGPVIQPLYGELCGALDRAGLTPAGPGIAYYEDLPEGDGVLVHAALPVNADLGRDHHGFSILDLPEIEQAATIVHRGSMDDVMPTIQTLARWIDANGYRSAGYNRELYIECGEDRETWVTELQEPVASDSGRAQVADHSSTETDRPQNVHECRPTSTGLGTTHAAPVGSTLRVGTRGPELEGTKGAAGARWNDDDHLMQTLWTMPAEHWFPSAVEIESRSAHTSASTRGRPLVHRGRSSTECA